MLLHMTTESMRKRSVTDLTRIAFEHRFLVGAEGVEPTHGRLKAGFLIQLNYSPKFFSLLPSSLLRTHFHAYTNR